VELVDLGESGLRVSRVGLGCNNFGGRIDFDATRTVVEAALDAGVTFFDTAATYGSGDSERFLGEILEGRRGEVVVAHARVVLARHDEQRTACGVDAVADRAHPVGLGVVGGHRDARGGDVGRAHIDAARFLDHQRPAPSLPWHSLQPRDSNRYFPSCRTCGVGFA